MTTDSKIADITKEILRHYPQADTALVERAYTLAEKAHAGQIRMNGAPFITHSLGTAAILASWRLPPDIVVAGLLHDVAEDTKYTIQDIKEQFGADIAKMVEGETKLDRLKTAYKGQQRYAENLRKMFMAIAADVRVIFIKFADRLHNLSTVEGLPDYKKERMTRETLDIYAPIANRLGMGAIRGELEDLSFKYVQPTEYEWALGLLVERVPPKEEYLEQVRKLVEDDLKANHVNPISIHGRVKRLYSLYKKLLEKDRDISKVYDLVAQRIIVPSVQDCYATLGVIHARWRPLKGRIKDYIAQPKPNGYQSLHTTVFCEDGEIVEFQIRTEQMHEEAEFGIAAHWFYLEKGKKSVLPERQIKWLKDLVELQKNIQDRTKFMEALDSLKIDFFRNRIFVFTPKGDVLDLPDGSTPIDFAYAIHTEVGNHCTGTRVNEQIAPLSTILQSGDIVEITTDKNRKSPSADWLAFVKTSHARAKIKEGLHKSKLTGWIKELVHRKG